MRPKLPVRLAKANTRTAGREIIVTNGLSVRQEHGCGWLFQHAKRNRLCLLSYSIKRDCVIVEVLALFALLSVASQRDTRPIKNICSMLFLFDSGWRDVKCEHIRSHWSPLRGWLYSNCAAIPWHNAWWPVITLDDLICSYLVIQFQLNLSQSWKTAVQLS